MKDDKCNVFLVTILGLSFALAFYAVVPPPAKVRGAPIPRVRDKSPKSIIGVWLVNIAPDEKWIMAFRDGGLFHAIPVIESEEDASAYHAQFVSRLGTWKLNGNNLEITYHKWYADNETATEMETKRVVLSEDRRRGNDPHWEWYFHKCND